MTDVYFLSKGSHPTPTADDGKCAMEWVSYLAGEKHSDTPVCVSPVLSQFCIGLNDALDDKRRQRLRPYLARTIGTYGDGLDQQRGFMCMDWIIRTYTPTWLALAGLDDAAKRLRSLPPILAAENVTRAMEDLNLARSEAAAAWDAAWDAVWGAAGDAAWDAAGDAARDAVWAAAWAAAGDAVWAAAWAVARAAAGDAAGAAAGDALRPTVEALQDLAFVLLDRMLPLEVVQVPVVSEWREICGLVA